MVDQNHQPGGNSLSPRQFEEFFLPHLESAYNLARWLLRHEQNAEDAVQEAYLRAYRAFPRFRGAEGKPWLMTIVRHVCYSSIKKLRQQELLEPFDELLHQTATPFTSVEATAQRAQVEVLHQALLQLPPEFREMIVLHDLEGLSYKEISRVVEVPLGTVMSRLARARARLRQEIMVLNRKESSA